MQTERPTDALRLERQLANLRWLVAAFGAVQVGFAIRDRGDDPRFALPLAVALVLGLTIGNLAIANSVRRGLDPAQLRSIGIAAFVLDAVVLSGLVWIVPSGPADPVWVIGYLIPLEGAARWGLRGGLLGAAVFLAGQALQENARAQIAAGASQVGFRAGMAFVIGGVAGSFVSSLRRTADEAAARAGEAAAEAARAELAASQAAQAQREVAAFHAAVLADAQPERLAEILRATADPCRDRARVRGARAAHPCDRRRGRGSVRCRGRVRRPGLPPRRRTVPRLEPGGGGRGRGRDRPRRRGPRRPDAGARRRGRARCTSVDRARPTPRGSRRCRRSPTSSG